VRAQTTGSIRITWGAEHRDGKGNLIVRQTSIEPPNAPECLSPGCLWRYLIDSLTFVLVASYHTRRVVYAEANRNKKILERYRTGAPSPNNFWWALYANIKLACPFCRKINTKR